MIEAWKINVIVKVINYGPDTIGYFFPETGQLKIHKIGSKKPNCQVSYEDVLHATHLACFCNKDTIVFNDVYAFKKENLTIVFKLNYSNNMLIIRPQFK